ncbi:carbonic anhydrase [Agromyces cerinus]|uniref:carbonic anhydrase n=1 Tax=Agromyces hippuratus TaxID=286438 RepID=A0A852XA97_9MICO|nr:MULTISPECIES: carbonic anhydrase [Agromyces]MBM7831395.1 carbonic anhydrase [Agromyces cerinus]NYG22765.1 carbonic anhydrase [Agromyces hippuratus]
MTTQPKDRPQTPAETWRELRSGNTRFVEGKPLHPRQDVDRRASLAHAQRPLVAIFGCSDSRLAAEIIFDVGLGDAFVVRNAGQVVTPSSLGSLEYAVGLLHVPLVIVLAHDECGAVRAAIDSEAEDATPLPVHIAGLVEKIVPAVRKVAGGAADAPVDPAHVDTGFVGREHLRNTVTELVAASEMISDAIAAGTLAIVGANYRLFEGRVETDIVVGSV